MARRVVEDEEAERVLFLGDDWAEAHHDVELIDEDGRVLARRRLPEGVTGLAALHGLVADHLDEDADPERVLVGIETDRGPWVQALIAVGYTVYAINPLQVARYRERHGVSGAKSDPGDAHTLAELVRLDRAHHRPVAGDSEVAGHVKVLARSHQTMIWSRQRQTNLLRSMLREYYPAALAALGEDLAGRDALAVLALAPTPEQGRALSRARIETALRRAGRQRNSAATAERIQAALRSEQLAARAGVVGAYGASVRALVAVITELARQIAVLDGEVTASFGRHPDAGTSRGVVTFGYGPTTARTTWVAPAGPCRDARLPTQSVTGSVVGRSGLGGSAKAPLASARSAANE